MCVCDDVIAVLGMAHAGVTGEGSVSCVCVCVCVCGFILLEEALSPTVCVQC